MPEPPQLGPFNAKEQQFYSESLMDDWTSHLIPKGDAGLPPEETHFSKWCKCKTAPAALILPVSLPTP